MINQEGLESWLDRPAAADQGHRRNVTRQIVRDQHGRARIGKGKRLPRLGAIFERAGGEAFQFKNCFRELRQAGVVVHHIDQSLRRWPRAAGVVSRVSVGEIADSMRGYWSGVNGWGRTLSHRDVEGFVRPEIEERKIGRIHCIQNTRPAAGLAAAPASEANFCKSREGKRLTGR